MEFKKTNNISNELIKIKKIACGGSHSLALTFSKDLFTWGYGEEGQLGLGDTIKCVKTPQRINFIGKRLIVKVYSGYSHSMAISEDGNVFIWGSGEHSQYSISRNWKPVMIDLFQKNASKG